MTIENSTLLVGTYHLSVLARDKGSPSLNGSVSVHITVIPETVQFSQSVYSFEVSEDAPFEYYIGEVGISDQTNGSQTDVSYVFISTPNTCITLNPNSGQIRVNCSLDRESQMNYELAVSAVNGEFVGFSKVVVDILDVNDNPPEFEYEEYARVINSDHMALSYQ